MIDRRTIKLFFNLLFILLLVGLIYFFREPLGGEFGLFWQKFNYIVQREIAALSPPCQKPIDYSLGEIDSRFQISRADLLLALEKAGSIWSQPSGRQLFVYATSGKLKINLVYDYRQAATNKLKTLGIIVTNDRQSYDVLKTKYDLLNQQYLSQKSSLDLLVADFKNKQAAYDAEVERWNKRGGAPPKEYDRLSAEQKSLEDQLVEINLLTDKINALVDNLNAEGTVLNKLIDQLNLNTAKYNSIGASTASEFQEGVYTENQSGKAITVYEFNSKDQLVRLLAHEFGHALGLNHSTGTNDIMYYLNTSGKQSLTNNDLAALKNKCGIK